jgi:hypothetical protein
MIISALAVDFVILMVVEHDLMEASNEMLTAADLFDGYENNSAKLNNV